jgi:cytochrome c553
MLMHHIKQTIVGLASVLAASIAVAQEPNALQSKLRECAGCHGLDGISIAPTMPNLAGQKEQYLITALTAYRDGTRTGGNAAMMTPMASGLTDEQIAGLAKHFSSLE